MRSDERGGVMGTAMKEYDVQIDVDWIKTEAETAGGGGQGRLESPRLYRPPSKSTGVFRGKRHV